MGPFETVHTVTDYYDGPRRGIADFGGQPHVFTSEWDDSEDSYAEVFQLRRVDRETFELALEDWQVWLRWQDAFHRREVTTETHPALPRDRARHDEIQAVLSERLANLPGPVIRARATFDPTPGPSRTGELRVHWMPIQPPDGALSPRPPNT
jgi:hypothetical protein